MIKKQPLSVTLDPEVRAYLEDLARQDRRSKSAMVEAIIAEHAKRNGKSLTISTFSLTPRLSTTSEV